jgi:hypothetical protein
MTGPLGAYILDARYFKEHTQLLAEAGIGEVVFGFDTPENILSEAKESFEVFLEFKPFATSGISEYFVENLFGQRRDLDALGCPSNRKLRERNLFKLKEKLLDVKVSGIILDFVRFPSFVDGDFFYSCFCEECSRAHDYIKLKRDVERFYRSLARGEIRADLLSDWLSFKRDVISGYVGEFVRFLPRRMEKRAFLFSPSLSPMVGQDYERLSSLLDVIHPMIYPEGGLGPACLGFEIWSFVSKANLMLEDVYSFLGIEDPCNPKDLESLKARGLPAEIIRRETEKAIELSNTEVRPIITVVNIPPKDTVERIELAMEGGAKAVHLFGFSPETAENFSALKELG